MRSIVLDCELPMPTINGITYGLSEASIAGWSLILITRELNINFVISCAQHLIFEGKLVENMTRIMSSPTRREKHVVIRSRNETGMCSLLTNIARNANQRATVSQFCEG